MATRERTRSARRSNDGRSAFNWGTTGALAGAAVGGAVLAIAANLGRKLAVQGLSATRGNWAESLAAEHEAVLALFDKLLATDDDQTSKRTMLLIQISHALDKHAYAEEHVVYPSLREDNQRVEAETLETEHGGVKTFIHRLTNMAKDDPAWIGIVREFRDSVARHAKMEEEEVFPALRRDIDEETDARITKEVNKAGFMMA